MALCSSILRLDGVLSVPLLQVRSRPKLNFPANTNERSTTWVAEVFYAAIPIGTPPPSSDTATRAGSLALLLFAIVAFLSGSFLPWLSTLGRKPFIARLSHTSRKARAFRGSLCLLTPRNFWTMGLAMYALCMIGTFWVKSVHGAMVIIALLGVPWAINCWVRLLFCCSPPQD